MKMDRLFGSGWRSSRPVRGASPVLGQPESLAADRSVSGAGTGPPPGRRRSTNRASPRARRSRSERSRARPGPATMVSRPSSVTTCFCWVDRRAHHNRSSRLLFDRLAIDAGRCRSRRSTARPVPRADFEPPRARQQAREPGRDRSRPGPGLPSAGSSSCDRPTPATRRRRFELPSGRTRGNSSGPRAPAVLELALTMSEISFRRVRRRGIATCSLVLPEEARTDARRERSADPAHEHSFRDPARAQLDFQLRRQRCSALQSSWHSRRHGDPETKSGPG